MVAKGTKKFTVKELRQRTDGNEMDLSMSQIEEIPVKDIATIKKVDTLDLSINLIVSVPEDFCVLLQRLVKLDLSKNRLKELPDNFGMLQQLQHLDLYHNQLRLIPISFSQLKKLKWLDVKDNPLDPSYKKHVGDCLDDKQCRQCAKSVVAAMKQILAKREQQRIKKLEQQKKAALLQQEQELAELKKREKNQERKRRKKEREKKAKIAQNGFEKEPELIEEPVDGEDFTEKELTSTRKESYGTWIFIILAVLAAVSVGVYFYCGKNHSVNHCQTLHDYIESFYPVLNTVREKATVLGSEVAGYASESMIVLKVEFSKLLDRLHVYYNDWTKS